MSIVIKIWDVFPTFKYSYVRSVLLSFFRNLGKCPSCFSLSFHSRYAGICSSFPAEALVLVALGRVRVEFCLGVPVDPCAGGEAPWWVCWVMPRSGPGVPHELHGLLTLFFRLNWGIAKSTCNHVECCVEKYVKMLSWLKIHNLKAHWSYKGRGR